MKSKLITLLCTLTFAVNLAFGHGGVQIGPNGGRVLEFSKNETMHGEVTVKDGKFHIVLLDKDLKPVAVADQVIIANGGPTGKAMKLAVEKTEKGFTIPELKSGEWLVLQFKEKSGAKAVTARMEYNTSNCGECSSPEWLCKCSEEKK